MRFFACVLFLAMLTGCTDDSVGELSVLSDMAKAAPAHRTDREKHLVEDTILHWGQWELHIPQFYSWMDWGGPICGGVIEYPWFSFMNQYPQQPDSTGVLAFDANEFRDSAVGALLHCWTRDNAVMPLGEDVIKHTIRNTGTLPIRIDSVSGGDNCASVFCHRTTLLPGDSTTLWFKTNRINSGWNGFQVNLHYTKLQHYPGSGRSEVQVFEVVSYFINYSQLE